VISLKSTKDLTWIGFRKAATPTIRSIFAKFDPTTLPSAMADEPARVASILTKNSGKEVPNEIIVTPIRRGEIFSL
jgi:hypothetical protein